MNCYTREQIEATMASKGYKYFTGGDYDVNIIGVRNSETKNRVTNAFDDCITLSYKIEGEWQFHCFKCTTDPGTHWVENVINEKINIDHQVRQSTENPNHWEYNNEFAMNGGTMGGIVGFDGLESQYAGFGSLLDLKENSNEKNENNIPHDDLRKPIVYEN